MDVKDSVPFLTQSFIQILSGFSADFIWILSGFYLEGRRERCGEGEGMAAAVLGAAAACATHG